MSKLQKFLGEVKRTVPRAIELGAKLAKRHSGSSYIDQRSYDHYRMQHDLDAVYGNHTRFRHFDHLPTVNIPVKGLHATQDSTKFDSQNAEWKMKDTNPIIVLKIEGKHYIWNGHHRVIAAKLKGDKTIQAKVWDPTKDESRGHEMEGRNSYSATRSSYPPMVTSEDALDEVKRDIPRATKLGVYLARRHKREGHVPNMGQIAFPSFQQGERKKAYTAADELPALDNPKTKPPVMVPMKHLIPTQISTAFRARYAERKLKDSEPIEVLHYHEHEHDHTGKMYILNGHHRYVAHRLKGEQQIPARIFHYYADKDGRPRNEDVLDEVKRDLDRATKLGSYLAKRHNTKYRGVPVIKHKEYDSDAVPDLDRQVTSKRFSQARMVPIKHLIPTQSGTHFQADRFKGWKAHDNDPITVVKHNNEHYIWDGHHRVLAHKLKGETHISAKVVDLDGRHVPGWGGHEQDD